MKNFSFARSGTTRALLLALMFMFLFSACDSGGGGDSGTNPDPNPKPTPVKEVAAIILSGDMPNEIGETEEITATVLDQDNNAWTEQELTDSSITVNIVASSNAVTITKKSVTKADITAVTNCTNCIVSASAGSVQSQNSVQSTIYPDPTVHLTTCDVIRGNQTDTYNIGFIKIGDNLYDLQGLLDEGTGGNYKFNSTGTELKAQEVNSSAHTFTVTQVDQNGAIKKLQFQRPGVVFKIY